MVEVLVAGVILAAAGVGLARALAAVAAADTAAAETAAENEWARAELRRVTAEMERHPGERRPAFFDADRRVIERPGWTIRTRCRASDRDRDFLWVVSTTMEGGRRGTPTTLWVFRPRPDEGEGAR